MRISESMIINTLVLVVLLALLGAGEGCTHVVHSDEPQWEYPTR